jgi:ABC-type transport system involved in cytochrome c biogenesis permease subunit
MVHTYALLLAILFLAINFLHPETYEKTLMPALQSPWFVPHVIVYIFSYALLAASSLVAVKGLYELYFKEFDQNTLHLADNLVYIGFSFLTLASCLVHCGRRRHGDITGHGIQKKHGPSLPGWPTWFTCISEPFSLKKPGLRCGP